MGDGGGGTGGGGGGGGCGGKRGGADAKCQPATGVKHRENLTQTVRSHEPAKLNIHRSHGTACQQT